MSKQPSATRQNTRYDPYQSSDRPCRRPGLRPRRNRAEAHHSQPSGNVCQPHSESHQSSRGHDLPQLPGKHASQPNGFAQAIDMLLAASDMIERPQTEATEATRNRSQWGQPLPEDAPQDKVGQPDAHLHPDAPTSQVNGPQDLPQSLGSNITPPEEPPVDHLPNSSCAGVSAAPETLPSPHRGSTTSPSGPWGAPTATGFKTEVQDHQGGFPPSSAPPFLLLHLTMDERIAAGILVSLSRVARVQGPNEGGTMPEELGSSAPGLPQHRSMANARRRHKKTVDTSSKARQKRKRKADGGEGNAADARESRQPKRARLENLPMEQQQQPPAPPPCRRSERIRAIGQKKDVAPPPEVKNPTMSTSRRAVRRKVAQ